MIHDIALYVLIFACGMLAGYLLKAYRDAKYIRNERNK